MAEIDGLAEKRSTLCTTTRAIQRDTSSGMTIHFDATFNRRDFKSMAGLVVQDQMGVILVTKTVLNSNVSTSFTAEAYAGLHAINLRLSLGIHSITVKGDSRTVIKKCQTSMQDKLVIGEIISDIQKKSEFFQEIMFQFINRTENISAHKIAEEALRREKKHTWKERHYTAFMCVPMEDGVGSQIENDFLKEIEKLSNATIGFLEMKGRFVNGA